MPSAPTKSRAAAPTNSKPATPAKPVETATADERAAAGKAAREKASRASHGEWEPAARRRDPVKVLEDQAKSRVQELVPIRYGRMLASPFTFYRGAAAIMAMDLAKTPDSGLRVQACGDAHLSNFGVFAAPDRRLVLDVNDFDETLPGPWEWDVKRLAASFEIAGRDRDFTPKETRAAVLRAVRHYREAMRRLRRDAELRRLVRAPRRRHAARRPGQGRQDRKQMKTVRKNVKQGREEEQPQGVRSARPRGRWRAADHQRSAAAGSGRRAGFGGSAPSARGADHRDARPLPREPRGGPPPPNRQLPVRRNGPQGGRGRQRRDARLGGADDGPRRAGPALHAGQGGRGLGARALRRGERVRKPRPAGGRGPVADADRERCPSRLASGDSGGTTRPSRLLRAPALGREAIGRDRDPATGGAGDIRARCAAGRWPEPMHDRATGSRSAPTSARATASIRRSPSSPSATRTRTSSITPTLADAAKSGRIKVETDLD